MVGTPGDKFTLTEEERLEAAMQECPNGDNCAECGECREARIKALERKRKKERQ